MPCHLTGAVSGHNRQEQTCLNILVVFKLAEEELNLTEANWSPVSEVRDYTNYQTKKLALLISSQVV